MTINEAIKAIQGKSAGLTGRATVNYAQDQLYREEKVFAASSANIRSHHGNYPGIIVFTDQRLFAASGMPGIRRTISLPLKDLRQCRDLKSPLSYNVSLATKLDRFSAVLSPQAGKNFAPYFSALKRALSGELSQTSQQLSGQFSR